MKVVQRALTYPELRLIPNDGKRYELVNGELYVNGEKASLDTALHPTRDYVTPSPSERHQRVSSRLFVSMYLHVESKRLGRVYYAPFDVVLS